MFAEVLCGWLFACTWAAGGRDCLSPLSDPERAAVRHAIQVESWRAAGLSFLPVTEPNRFWDQQSGALRWLRRGLTLWLLLLRREKLKFRRFTFWYFASFLVIIRINARYSTEICYLRTRWMLSAALDQPASHQLKGTVRPQVLFDLFVKPAVIQLSPISSLLSSDFSTNHQLLFGWDKAAHLMWTRSGSTPPAASPSTILPHSSSDRPWLMWWVQGLFPPNHSWNNGEINMISAICRTMWVSQWCKQTLQCGRLLWKISQLSSWDSGLSWFHTFLYLLVMYTPQSVSTGPGFKHEPAPVGNIWFQSKYSDGKWSGSPTGWVQVITHKVCWWCIHYPKTHIDYGNSWLPDFSPPLLSSSSMCHSTSPSAG